MDIVLEFSTPGPEDIKLLMLISAEHEIFHPNNANSFLLNVTEHEIFSANKCESANYCWHFHIC